MRVWSLLAALALMLTVPAGVGAASAPDGDVQILVLSNRADLISGSDALVEVVLPENASAEALQVHAEGRVTGPFAARPSLGGRVVGVVDGLEAGDNVLTARLPDGRGARITITNHPIGGPLFAGPQVQPWICTTEDNGLGTAGDEQCNAATTFELLYMPEDGSGLTAYDPDDPPDDIAQTTTDQGVTVPFIVRRERGVIDRGIYAIAVLFDPAQPWEPWSPQAGWNRKLFYRFSGDCNPNHRQPTADNVLNEHALSRGFAVASSGLNHLGSDCNDVVSAEAVAMVKEHLIDRYGEVRYTMSSGESGGAMQQHWIVSNYPGLLDGIIPNGSFPDVWMTLFEAEDCFLLDRAFAAAGIVTPEEILAVSGHGNVQSCTGSGWTLFARVWQDPTFDFACQGGASHAPASAEPASWVYRPGTNPTGERCTLQDYQVALFGRRPPEAWAGSDEEAARGFANRPYDNTGVEYGREALEDGVITPEQFVSLNMNVGGYDIDWVPQLERNVADPAALVAAYRGGRVTYPRSAAGVPIIDTRPFNPCDEDAAFRIHTCFYTYAMRARLEQANGHADNQVILFQDPTDYAFDLLDEWLTAIEADQSEDPREIKVVRNKPADAVNACWPAGERLTDWAQCQELNPSYGNPRLVAGGPLAGNVLKCQLKSLDRAEYSVRFSDEQWARMQAAFPDGVCDYSQPGVAQQPSIPWLTYLADDGLAIPGGRALGGSPSSTPFGPDAAGGSVPAAEGPMPATGGGAVLPGLATILLLAGSLLRKRQASIVPSVASARYRFPRRANRPQ